MFQVINKNNTRKYATSDIVHGLAIAKYPCMVGYARGYYDITLLLHGAVIGRRYFYATPCTRQHLITAPANTLVTLYVNKLCTYSIHIVDQFTNRALLFPQIGLYNKYRLYGLYTPTDRSVYITIRLTPDSL